MCDKRTLRLCLRARRMSEWPRMRVRRKMEWIEQVSVLNIDEIRILILFSLFPAVHFSRHRRRLLFTVTHHVKGRTADLPINFLSPFHT